LLSEVPGQEAPLQGREIHPKASRMPAITASASEMMSTQNIARGPVPWRTSVVVLVRIKRPFCRSFVKLRTCQVAVPFRRANSR
jgi:hypothetical protein